MYADAVFIDEPAWSRRPGRRLFASFLPAALIVAGALACLRLPVVELEALSDEIFVRILEPRARPAEPSPDQTDPLADPAEVAAPVATRAEPREQIDSPDAVRDWYAMIEQAAQAAVDVEKQTGSVNPGFDQKRRDAAEQFRPSRAPVERPIWDNVEKDTLGRTVLVSGNCMRVLDDPNVGNRDAFLTFGQFLVQCRGETDAPRPLPWVNELRIRRAGPARSGRRVAE